MDKAVLEALIIKWSDTIDNSERVTGDAETAKFDSGFEAGLKKASLDLSELIKILGN